MARSQPITPAGSDVPTRAAARAAQLRRRSLLLLGLVILLVVALVVVLGVFFIRGGAASDASAQLAAPEGECLPAELSVTADPAVAGALEAIVSDLSGSRTDCPEVTIRSEDSAVTAAALAAGSAPEFDAWIPDSAMWPARAAALAELAGAASADLVVGDAVASTPVVFAATQATADAIAPESVGFASLARRAVAAVLPDPQTVAASSAALLALQTAVKGDARTFTATVLGLATGIVPSVDDALAAASAATSPTIAVTTEQAVREAAAETPAAETPLVAIYPVDVKPSVGMPLVTLAGAPETIRSAVRAFSAAVAAGSGRLVEFGLRDASGNGEPAPSALGADDAGNASEPVDGVNQAGTLRTWQVLTAPSRMLSLNDVSGSMDEPATADLRRIDLFEQAAVAAVNALSADSSLATWVFSSMRIGAQDWQEVVPFGPLSDPAHKQRTIDTANSLDSYVGGGTGLYDSVLAAVTYMRETYVPGEVNLVLLNTDGYNEDDDGLDLQGLLTELAALRDPARPVAVIAIGYGPDTDQSALEQIAAATDGAAYQALQPTDILTVLVDAVTQRGCRPNCG